MKESLGEGLACTFFLRLEPLTMTNGRPDGDGARTSGANHQIFTLRTTLRSLVSGLATEPDQTKPDQPDGQMMNLSKPADAAVSGNLGASLLTLARHGVPYVWRLVWSPVRGTRTRESNP